MGIKKLFSAALKTVLIIFFTVSLFFAVLSVSLKLSNGGNAPVIFGFGFFEVLTDSMAPEINVGEVVITKKTKIEKLSVGDNITFKYREKINTHKIVEIRGDVIITRGVNAPADDGEPVAFDDVIGKVIAHSAAFGFFASFLKSWYGFVFFIIVPSFILISYETYNLGKKLKKRRGENHNAAKRRQEANAVREEIGALREKLRKSEHNDK